MARRLMTSRFSPRLSWILSMYGSWFPSVSTQMLYGFRSSVQSGVVQGWTVFQELLVSHVEMLLKISRQKRPNLIKKYFTKNN